MMDEPTLETTFIGKKSGCCITIHRHGPDDYEADWEDDFSVRGTLKDIMNEVKEEL